MKEIRAAFISCLLLSAITVKTNAQSSHESFKTKLERFLQARYNKVNYDTTYIERPKAKLTLKMRVNVSGNSINSSSKEDGFDVRSNMKTAHRGTLSFGVNYLGISAGFSLNPASLSGQDKDYELNLNINSKRISLDASYQISKTLAGNVVGSGIDYNLDPGHVHTRMLNVTGYYIFNHRKFSNQATFSQSFIQKHSAGSWMAGFAYQGGLIKTTEERPADFPDTRISVGLIGLGGGYGHNFVVGKKWLFHLSILPTLIIFNTSSFTYDGVREDVNSIFPDMILNERAAIVHNFSNKYFAGATVIVSNTLFDSKDIVINQNKWMARAFFGIRFL